MFSPFIDVVCNYLCVPIQVNTQYIKHRTEHNVNPTQYHIQIHRAVSYYLGFIAIYDLKLCVKNYRINSMFQTNKIKTT